MRNPQSSTKHDDMQWVLWTALTWVTTRTPTQYRNTWIVLNEVASWDVFSMVFQFSHRKRLTTPLDSVHLHFIPKAAQNWNIAFTYAWWWYNEDTEIPNTLPNIWTTADIALVAADQYKCKIRSMVINLAAPASEAYSSILYIKLVAAAPAAWTNRRSAWGTNRIAIEYMDAHYITDRRWSNNETTD